MRVAIMQPTYLPWIGYFNLIAEADAFVFLDDVQFARRSWQQRNRILLEGRERMLTVPVRSKGRREQRIAEVEVDDQQPWRRTHLRVLRAAYGRHPFGEEVLGTIEPVLLGGEVRLASLTVGLIRALAGKLGLETRWTLGSELQAEGRRSERLLDLCRRLGATRYLSAAGSRDYIEAEGRFADAGVPVSYQDYRPRPYPQRGAASFVSHLSLVDLVANVGWAEAARHARAP